MPNNRIAIWDSVIADMRKRDAIGLASYKTRLHPLDGRDTLQDAYEEALDLAVYLKKKIVEEELTKRFAVMKKKLTPLHHYILGRMLDGWHIEQCTNGPCLYKYCLYEYLRLSKKSVVAHRPMQAVSFNRLHLLGLLSLRDTQSTQTGAKFAVWDLSEVGTEYAHRQPAHYLLKDK